MSAPGEDTLGEERDVMEEMDEAGSDEDEGVEMEEGAEPEKKVYVPGKEPLKPGEELEMDRSAYRMYHECQTGRWTLLQFSRVSISDSIADSKQEVFVCPQVHRV